MAEGLGKYTQKEWDAIMAGIDARENASNAKKYGQAYADSAKDFFGF